MRPPKEFCAHHFNAGPGDHTGPRDDLSVGLLPADTSHSFFDEFFNVSFAEARERRKIEEALYSAKLQAEEDLIRAEDDYRQMVERCDWEFPVILPPLRLDAFDVGPVELPPLREVVGFSLG